MSDIPSPKVEVEEGSPMGGDECSESPAHIMEPQVELNDEFEPVSLEPKVELNEHVELEEGADHYAYGSSVAVQYYEGVEDGTDSNSNFVEGESDVQDYHSADADINGISHDSEETSADVAIHDNSRCNSVDNTSLDAESLAMDTSNSEAFDSSYKEEETNYSEMQRSYLEDFYSSSVSTSGAFEELTDPTIERIPLCRFPSIVKVVERAEYETLQILYQLLYQRSAWDTQEILSKRILEFSGFTFGKNSEEYYNREMMLQTLPNSVLVKIGAILCLDHVKNVLSNVGLGRHDLINAILEFLALPKKKTRGPRQSAKRAVSAESVEPCGCRMNCLAKFSAIERQFIAEYWQTIKKKKLQDAYFVNLIKVNKSSKRSPHKLVEDGQEIDSPKKTRDYKYTYKIILGNKEVDVCKGGFMMLHNVKVSRLNQLQARLKKGVWFSKADVAATLCPAAPGTEEPPRVDPKPNDPQDKTEEKEETTKTDEQKDGVQEESSKEEQDKEESNDSSIKNSTTNSVEDSSESMSSKTEDGSEEVSKFNDEVKKTVVTQKVPAVMVEKIDTNKLSSQKGKNKKKGEQPNTSEKDSNIPQEVDDGVRKKLKEFPLVVKSLEEASEELLIDLHFLLFLSSAESSKLKDDILEFDGFNFDSETEEYDERNEFLQRMSGKLITDVARSFSLGVMSKREETIENILSFLMKPKESYLRTAPSVPVILSDVELDDIEGMSDSDESITCEVVEKKVECIDLLTEGDDLSSGEDSDNEGKKKKKKPEIKVEKVETTKPVSGAVAATSSQMPSSTNVSKSAPTSSESTSSGIIRRLKDFETIRKIVNTHPPEYLVDIYELLFLKQHEPATLREEILSFTGFDFDKSSQDYVKRKQVLDRMLYNNVRRVYNTLIHNSTEVKVFSKPTMINEIFQFLFKLPDTDTSVRPLPPGAKTLMPKPANVQASKPKTTTIVNSPTAAPSPTTILSSNSGKLSDLKRVFQRVACFPCEYLVDVHKLLFMSDCDPKVIRQNIFGFKGFSFGVDSPEFQQRKMYLEYLTFHSLRKISSVLTTRSVDLRNSTKHELASHLTDVLAEYCNTLVETESIVPTVSNTPSVVTPTVIPATSSSTVENIVITPIIEGLQSGSTATTNAVSTRGSGNKETSGTTSAASSKASTSKTSASTPMSISIVDTRSISSAPAVSVPSLTPTPNRGRKRKAQTVRQIVSEKKVAQTSPAQAESQFADIHLPEVEQYQQIYGTNLNVFPNVPTITGITSFGTPVPQTFPQIMPQTMPFPYVSPYSQALQVQNMQQNPQVLGLQSTGITMPNSILTQVSASHGEMIVPADVEKPHSESKVCGKSDISKLEISPCKDEEEDGDQPLASLIGHPTDEVLEHDIKNIVKKTNLQDITMNKVIQRIYDMYPHFDLSYRKDFIKSTLRSILYKLGNQNSGKKNNLRDSSSPDCSVSTTGNCDGSLPASPEGNSSTG